MVCIIERVILNFSKYRLLDQTMGDLEPLSSCSLVPALHRAYSGYMVPVDG